MTGDWHGREGTRSSDAEQLRAEVDRLRLENQELAASLEDARSLSRTISWHGRRLWHEAWQRYYIARWHLLHGRDPRRGLKVREQYDPYRVRQPVAAPAGRPRILHVIGNFHTGGSARLVVDLVERLGDRYEQKVFVRSLPPTPAYTNLELIHGERAGGPRGISSVLRSFEPQLVHVHMLGHLHDEYGRRDWRWYREVFRSLEAAGVPCIENVNIPVEPFVSPAVRCYVYVSDTIRHEFGRRSAWNETIHPGSDLNLFSRPAGAPLPDDHIGMVYRLQPDKLDERSIEPFVEVVRRRPRTRVSIIGGGQFLERYRTRVEAAGVADAFTFTGYVPYERLPELLAGIGIFVAPVHTESFGQVSPFAMGMGMPVVGYDVGALREITGAPELLAPSGDAPALASIILDLLDDRDRRLRVGQTNRDRALALFSVESMIERYKRLYDEVLATADRSRETSAAPRSTVAGVTPSSRPPAPGVSPTVTVLLAVRDGERFLRSAIDSLLRQSFGAFELLIVDDASSDRTQAIIESYEDGRIRVLRNDTHRGLSASLNRGIRHARGRYIARLDADDVAEPGRLAAQVAFLDREADVAMVGSWYSIIDEHGRRIGERRVPEHHDDIRWMLRFCNAFAHSAVTIRKSALDEAGLYDESLRYAMDYDLWVRISARMRVANLGEFLVRWRTRTDSLTARLGEDTERLDRVADDVARRLAWPDLSPAERRRRAAILCGIVAGSPVDATVSDARWALGALTDLHADFCREHVQSAERVNSLRRSMRRDTATSLLWMAHRYPDTQSYGSAWSLMRLAARLDPGILRTRAGTSLAAKLVGGPIAVAAARAIARPRAPLR